MRGEIRMRNVEDTSEIVSGDVHGKIVWKMGPRWVWGEKTYDP